VVKRAVLLALWFTGCGGAAPANEAHKVESSAAQTPKGAVSAEHRAIVDAPDRDAEDKALDEGRKPGETLTFFGVKPQMKVAELGAGGGYTSELLGRAVGPSGTVFMQNSQSIMEMFAEKAVTARLAKPTNKNIVRVVRPFDDPFPPEAKDLDAVFVVLIYHDAFWFDGGVDRAKMNAAVMKALKPGGVYAIVDHSGRPGTGAKDVQTLHRIEETVVKDEIQKAGFKLAAEGDFLRNPADARDWNAAPMAQTGHKRGTTDRFVLKFEKPR
jgi:predicted methyltransferase